MVSNHWHHNYPSAPVIWSKHCSRGHQPYVLPQFPPNRMKLKTFFWSFGEAFKMFLCRSSTTTGLNIWKLKKFTIWLCSAQCSKLLGSSQEIAEQSKNIQKLCYVIRLFTRNSGTEQKHPKIRKTPDPINRLTLSSKQLVQQKEVESEIQMKISK